MPSAPSEPEKYSIEEMMERLKGTPSESPADGELVTRADGSQAIKVRKRKRRSTQPQNDQLQRTRRSRIFQVSAVLILLFTIALAVGAGIIYANSSPFREKLLRGITHSTGATVDIQQFRINPKTANAAQLILAWPEQSALKKLTLTQLTAEVFPSSFIGKALNGEDVTANYALLHLQAPQAARPAPYTADTPADLGINFNRFRARTLDLTLGNEASPIVSLTKSEGSLTPRNIKGLPELALYQGSLAITGWQKLRLDRAVIQFRGDETDIISLKVLNEKDDIGSCELSGTLFPYRALEPSVLAVSLKSFELAGMIGPALGRLFSGPIDSLPVAKSNFLSFMPTTDPASKLEIAFHTSSVSYLEVQGFTFLSELAQLLDYPWFERPLFDADSRGSIHREAGIVSLRKLDFENKGHLALQGEISISPDQKLSGRLRVGLAEGIVSTSTNARLKSIVSQPQDGFCWVTLKISGTATSPTDNFRELYSTAVISRESPTPERQPESSFEELTHPR